MNKSLLFLPDISGFTNFVQTTEVEHSQHVIAELLEILIEANVEGFTLAEVEGDALFFYKEEVVSLEKLLAQFETMFTAFYSHLKLLETNRICPCNACATAPNLELKIVAHTGELQFIVVQGNRKPFGKEVIEAHRLMKNSVQSDNYVLVSSALAENIGLPNSYHSKLFDFNKGVDEYDGSSLPYLFSIVDSSQLKLKPFAYKQKVELDIPPSLQFKKDFSVSAHQLLELVTNYRYRHHWAEGVDQLEFNEKEVTRLGSEHLCIINGKHLDFVTITKDGKPNQFVYGELTTSPAPVDELYQFFIVSPLTDSSSLLEVEVYWKAKSVFKKILLATIVKSVFRKNIKRAIDKLYELSNSINL